MPERPMAGGVKLSGTLACASSCLAPATIKHPASTQFFVYIHQIAGALAKINSFLAPQRAKRYLADDAFLVGNGRFDAVGVAHHGGALPNCLGLRVALR